MRRLRIVAAAVATIVVLVAIYQAFPHPTYPTNGPLRVTPLISITIPVEPGEVVTWGMPIHLDPPATVVLREVEPLEVVGLDIVGIAACYSPPSPAPDGSWVSCGGTGSGWRAPAGEMAPVDGTLVVPGPPGVGVLIGVRRSAGASVSGFAALRIVYDASGRRFEVTQPWSLVLRDKDDPPPQW